MTREEAAGQLDGCQYRDEGSNELWKDMAKSGLVAVFGGSDDLMYFAGGIAEELGASDGSKKMVNRAGLIENRCDDDGCPYHEEERKRGTPIVAHFGRDGFTWTYETTIPHSTFLVMEDEDTYCRGIVFALADVSDQTGEARAIALGKLVATSMEHVKNATFAGAPVQAEHQHVVEIDGEDYRITVAKEAFYADD
jgi:hypothetical protein